MKVGNIQHSTAPFFTVVENMISAGTALLHWAVEQLLLRKKDPDVYNDEQAHRELLFASAVSSPNSSHTVPTVQRQG